jgi:shikimate kinase
VLRPENLTALRRSGRLFFLDRSIEKLIATADRPLSSDAEALRRRYAERYDLYCAACDVRVDGDGDAEDVAAEIEREWMR